MSKVFIAHGKDSFEGMVNLMDEYLKGSGPGQMYVSFRDEWTRELVIKANGFMNHMKILLQEGSCPHEMIIVELGQGTEKVKKGTLYSTPQIFTLIEG